MNTLFTWGALSALLIAISGWQYMWGIYTRSVPRPLISTWSMWAILGLLLLVAYEKAGAKMDTTLPAAWMGFINPVLIVVLSLRYGELKWTRLDTWCSAIFAATIVGWYTLDNPLFGLLGGILADLISAFPQIRKNWMEPHDEAWEPWTVFCIGSGINLLAIEQWDFAQWLYPIYFTAGSASIAIPVILHRLGFYKNKATTQQV